MVVRLGRRPDRTAGVEVINMRTDSAESVIHRILILETAHGRNRMIPAGSAEIRVVLAQGVPSSTVRALLEKGYSVSFTHDADPAPGGSPLVHAPDLVETELPRLVERLEQMRVERGLRSGGAWKPWFPGYRLSTLHELHAVPEFLPVRGVRRVGRRQDSGAEPEQLQDRLSRLLPSLSRSGHHVSEVSSLGRSMAMKSMRTMSAARR